MLFSLSCKKKKKKEGLVYQISKAAVLGFKHMLQGTCALKTECVEAELHGLQESQLEDEEFLYYTGMWTEGSFLSCII